MIINESTDDLTHLSIQPYYVNCSVAAGYGSYNYILWLQGGSCSTVVASWIPFHKSIWEVTWVPKMVYFVLEMEFVIVSKKAPWGMIHTKIHIISPGCPQDG